MSGFRRDTGFRPRGRVEEPVHAVDRDAVRTAWRSFHATDGFEALVAEQIVEQAVAIGRAREPMEWMGLLVGRVCEDARGRYVCILGMVLDRDAKTGRHNVRSTLESEAATRALASELFPDCVAIGWIHGHIRHGASFSGVDRENQRSWRQPHAVGIVVDPWSPEILAVYRGPESERLVPVAANGPRPTGAAALHRRVRHPLPRRRLGTWRNIVCAALTLVAGVAGYAAGNVRALGPRVERLERSRVVTRRVVHVVVVVPAAASPVPEVPPAPVVCIAPPSSAELFCRAPPFSSAP